MAKEGRDPKSGKRSHRVVHLDGTVEYVTVEEDDVDTSSADSFPASDPPAFTGVTRTGNPEKRVQKTNHQ